MSTPRIAALALACTGLALGQAASAGPEIDATRGELLYSTHCIACHTTQVHWREKRLATDWDSLQALVQQWQDGAHLGWSDADRRAVASYLNDTVYHFPLPGGPVGRAAPPLVPDQGFRLLARAR